MDAQEQSVDSSQDSSARSRYRSVFKAAGYERKYTRNWTRRITNAREHHILARLLRRLDAPPSILDVACGTGRFGELLAKRSASLVCLDFSMPMLRLCRNNLEQACCGARYVQANALHLPFGDRSFDLVLAIRLLHHFPERPLREALMRQLFRVARCGVIVTFADRHSLKGRQRHVRQRWFGRKRGETMIDRAELFDQASALGFEPTTISRVSQMFSTQVYVLLQNRSEASGGAPIGPPCLIGADRRRIWPHAESRPDPLPSPGPAKMAEMSSSCHVHVMAFPLDYSVCP